MRFQARDMLERNRRSAFSVERFSTKSGEDKVFGSARQRDDIYDQWLKFLARNVIPYRLIDGPSRNSEFQVEAYSRSSNGFTIGRVATAAGEARLERNAAGIGQDGQDRFVVYTSLRGRFEVSQLGRDQACEPGVSVLVDSAEPLVHTKLGDNDTLFFVMPRRFVEQRVVQPTDTCIRPLSASSMALGRLAQQSFITLEQDANLISEPEFQSACRLIGDLVLLALGGAEDGGSGHLSIRRATLAKAKRVIRARLDDPDLTLMEIASNCRISLGYLHSLFREDGRTVWEYLKGERLQRARNLLESPAEATTVTDVALACGFSSMSQFSTEFRRAFGLCPRDILRQRSTPV